MLYFHIVDCMPSSNTDLVLFDTAVWDPTVAVQQVLIRLMVFYSVNLPGCCQRENFAISCSNPWG